MSKKNTGINFGHSSRSIYDGCAYDFWKSTAVGPGEYKVNPEQMYNCNGCLSTYGPRGGSYGVSTTVGNVVAQKQALVDVSSVLSNRNVPLSRCPEDGVNPINPTKFKMQDASLCNDYLDPIASRLSNPSKNYRGMSINRFECLNQNPQLPVFYPYAINTQLEARDNYLAIKPTSINGKVGPSPIPGQNGCKYSCSGNC